MVCEPSLEADLRADEELEEAASSFDALYEHSEQHQRSSRAIDLTTDAATFRSLSQSDATSSSGCSRTAFTPSSRSRGCSRPFCTRRPTTAGMAEHVVLRLQRRPGGLCAEVMRLVNVRLRSFGFIEG